MKKRFIAGACLLILACCSLTRAAVPASQDFNAISAQSSPVGGSLTFSGVTYSTDAIEDELRVDTVSNVTGGFSSLGTGNALTAIWLGTNTGTYLQFASVNPADKFKIASFNAEVWGHNSQNAEVYTIKGYDGGAEVASATVNFRISGAYGAGSSTISYTRLTTGAETSSSGDGANCGTLSFTGSAWGNVDRVRIVVADTPPNTILGVSIDNIVFEAPPVVDSTPPTVLSVVRQTPAGQTIGASTTSVVFRVTYSESVTNVTAANFAVEALNGGAVVGSVTGVSGSGATRDVTVSISSGAGEFRLNVVN